jgi:hypothetical protein
VLAAPFRMVFYSLDDLILLSRPWHWAVDATQTRSDYMYKKSLRSHGTVRLEFLRYSVRNETVTLVSPKATIMCNITANRKIQRPHDGNTVRVECINNMWYQ